MTPFLLSQILATVAFLLGIVSFQYRSREVVLICWFFSALFNASHFFVLEYYTPAALVLVTSMRFLTTAMKVNSQLMYLFVGLSLVAFFITYENYLSLVGLSATLVGTVAAFNRNGEVVRIGMMIAAIFWATHNALAVSPVATLMEASFFLSNFIAWRRFYLNGGSKQ